MPTSGDPLAAKLDELNALSDPAACARVAELPCRLAAGDLRGALVGESKRGKSTFCHGLLREAVRAGSTRRAVISLLDGSIFTAGIDRLEADLIDRLRTGHQGPVEIGRQSAPGQERERRRLSDQRRALVEQRDHIFSSASTGQLPTGGRSTGTEEERP